MGLMIERARKAIIAEKVVSGDRFNTLIERVPIQLLSKLRSKDLYHLVKLLDQTHCEGFANGYEAGLSNGYEAGALGRGNK